VTNQNINFPQVVQPIANKDGTVTPAWQSYFLNLFNKIGGSSGGVINSIIAGTGISANNSSGNVTIDNTGVTSLNSITGAVDLVNGSNVTISGSGQNITISAGSQGLTATITTAKLTTLGSNGSMTFNNGLLTASTPAT